LGDICRYYVAGDLSPANVAGDSIILFGRQIIVLSLIMRLFLPRFLVTFSAGYVLACLTVGTLTFILGDGAKNTIAWMAWCFLVAISCVTIMIPAALLLGVVLGAWQPRNVAAWIVLLCIATAAGVGISLAIQLGGLLNWDTIPTGTEIAPGFILLSQTTMTCCIGTVVAACGAAKAVNISKRYIF
jgi:lysylphosphatidylglycerol synthetase-like protein (DUF2156 family)